MITETGETTIKVTSEPGHTPAAECSRSGMRVVFVPGDDPQIIVEGPNVYPTVFRWRDALALRDVVGHLMTAPGVLNSK